MAYITILSRRDVAPASWLRDDVSISWLYHSAPHVDVWQRLFHTFFTPAWFFVAWCTNYLYTLSPVWALHPQAVLEKKKIAVRFHASSYFWLGCNAPHLKVLFQGYFCLGLTFAVLHPPGGGWSTANVVNSFVAGVLPLLKDILSTSWLDHCAGTVLNKHIIFNYYF